MEPNKQESSAPIDIPNLASETLVKCLDELWNYRKIEIVEDTFSEDCIAKTPFKDEITRGAQQFEKTFVKPLFDAFPDLKYISHEVIVDLPVMINRWTFNGTHKGTYHGFEASGNKVAWTGVTINRINPQTGKISEVSVFFDRKDLFDQLKKI